MRSSRKKKKNIVCGRVIEKDDECYNDIVKQEVELYGQSNEQYEGWKVVKNIYYLNQTIGLALEDLFDECFKKSMMPDWIALYDDMAQHGMKQDRIIGSIRGALGLTTEIPKAFSDIVVKRLKEYEEFKYELKSKESIDYNNEIKKMIKTMEEQEVECPDDKIISKTFLIYEPRIGEIINKRKVIEVTKLPNDGQTAKAWKVQLELLENNNG